MKFDPLGRAGWILLRTYSPRFHRIAFCMVIGGGFVAGEILGGGGVTTLTATHLEKMDQLLRTVMVQNVKRTELLSVTGLCTNNCSFLQIQTKQ